ncbi:serine/threonine protein kinase [Aureliella helgolandensis]|uniref:Tyrosine-protein kinase MasK n=1 Tax=Aureliella helgolandensis TaxID=2527968 RepID=A0A518GAD5_9BACT|nr:protein kinase [Aureliella helgolandensis]QDV25552.1 Tyrosine-protein kinase MasK [Aureliella helgolandensis]
MWQAGQTPVPGYKLERLLGKGNFGEVWQSTSPGGTKSALKFLNLRERHGRKEYRAIQGLKQIRHANLMPMNAMWLLDENQQVIPDDQLDVAQPLLEDTHRQTLLSVSRMAEEDKPKTLIIAMPLAEGNLLELLRQRQEQGQDIPVEELLIYMMDAARALDFLNSERHEHEGQLISVQHGDVKPENLVLLGGSVVLCDFGVARTMARGADTKGTTLGGSLAYMPPECLAGQVSPHSDQFSLAVSYAELRTGELPFADESMAQVIEDRKKGHLNLEGLTPGEQKVLRQACSVNPAKRFGSNVELVEALRNAVLENPSRDTRATWWLVGGVAALLLIAGGGLLWWPDDPAPTPIKGPDNTNTNTVAQPKTGKDFYAEAIDFIHRGEMTQQQLPQATELYLAALSADFVAEVPQPRRLGVLDNDSRNVYPIDDLSRISQLVAVHPLTSRILVVGDNGRSLVEPGSNAADAAFELQLESPIASVHWLAEDQVLVRDCESQLWRFELESQRLEAIGQGILRVASSPQSRLALAVSDGDGSGKSELLQISATDVTTAQPGVIDSGIMFPLIGMEAAGEWGAIVEEFERTGTVNIVSLANAHDAKRIATNIEAYCIDCLRLGEDSFAILCGEASSDSSSLALIRLKLPVNSESLITPSFTDQQGVFQRSGRTIRSLATWVNPEHSRGLIATGQDAGSGSPATELWEFLDDGKLAYLNVIGQETQAPSTSALAFDDHGEWLVRGTDYGEVLLTKLSNPQHDFFLVTADYAAEVLQLKIVDGLLIACFDDATIMIWDFYECQMVYEACETTKRPFPQPADLRPQAG